MRQKNSSVLGGGQESETNGGRAVPFWGDKRFGSRQVMVPNIVHTLHDTELYTLKWLKGWTLS